MVPREGEEEGSEEVSDNAYINDLEERLAEAEKQLTAANATIAACKEWTPASTPPSDSRFVLVWAPGYDVRLATYRPDIHEGYPWRSDTNHNCGVFFTPTHWKEVPPTPAAAKEAQ